jgi:hypothetical protein
MQEVSSAGDSHESPFGQEHSGERTAEAAAGINAHAVVKDLLFAPMGPG